MPMTRTTRRSIRIAIATALLVALVFAAQFVLDRMVRKKSLEVLASLCGPGSQVTIGAMDLRVFSGDLRWSQVRVEQPEDSLFAIDDHRAFHISGSIDTVAISGLSLWRAILGESLVVRDLRIIRPDLHVILRNDTITAAAAKAPEQGISDLRITGFKLEEGVLHILRAGRSKPMLVIDQFGMQATGVRADFRQGSSPVLQFASISGELSDIAASLSPLYDLHAACLELSQSGAQLQITDAELRPLAGPENYGKIVPFEVDLIAMRADTLMVTGLDINASIAQRGLKSLVLLMAGVDGELYRDKTLPDAAYSTMRLPMAGLRNLPFSVDVDSVLVQRWSIHYHERGELGPDYGEVLFSDIRGTITGLHTADTLRANEVHLVAQAKAYDQALITAEARTSIKAPNEQFTLTATIGAVPIHVFNRMTADLAGIRATAGRINNVNYRITGNDDHATGRVDVSYQDLEVSALKKDGSGDVNRFKTSMINLLVHSENLRSSDGFRHGDFSIDRQHDRAVFKYVWTGLREGMLAAMLPGVLDDIRKNNKPD